MGDGTQGAREAKPADVKTALGENCTKCDIKGKVFRMTVCEFCDHGWNHRKTDAGTYVCRICGAACESRFSACKCGRPDCPQCFGKPEKLVSVVCPLCGGDKIITPSEREKAKADEDKK
jgi:hypothetical protein